MIILLCLIYAKYSISTDDMAAVVVDNDLSNVEKKLQKATDELVAWSQSEGMDINVSKTKVMLFGSHGEKLNVMISVVIVAEICNSVGGGVLFDTPPRCRWRWRMSAVCTALGVRFNHLSRSLPLTSHHTAHVNRHRRR